VDTLRIVIYAYNKSWDAANVPRIGDDYKTLRNTKKRRTRDATVGNIIALYDLAFVDNLQVADIKALINTLIDEHIIEEDDWRIDAIH